MPKDVRNVRIAEVIFGLVGLAIIILVYFARPKPGARNGGTFLGCLFIFTSGVLAWVAFGMGLAKFHLSETCPDNYRWTLEGNTGHRNADGTYSCYERMGYAITAVALDAANGLLGILTAVFLGYNVKQGHWRMAPRGWAEAQLDAEVEPQKERIPGEMIQKNVTYVRKWIGTLLWLFNFASLVTLSVFFIFLHQNRELAEAHPLGGPIAAPNAAAAAIAVDATGAQAAPYVSFIDGCYKPDGLRGRNCAPATYITIRGANFDARLPANNAIQFSRARGAKGHFPTCSPISSVNAAGTQIVCPLWVPHGTSGYWNLSVVVSGVTMNSTAPRATIEVMPPGGGWPTQNTRLRYSASAIGILTIILNFMPFRSKAVALLFAVLYVTCAALCMTAFGFDIHALRRVGSSPCPRAPDGTQLACVKSMYIATTVFEFLCTLALLFYIVYEYVIKQRQAQKCQHCQRNFGIFELPVHVEDECSRRPVRCAICSKTMLAKEFVYKHRHECAVDHTSCERCGITVAAWGAKAHQEECPQTSVKCPTCESAFLRADLPSHIMLCPKKPVACDACGETFRGQAAIQEHFAVCPEVLVQCELCDDKMQRFRLQQHQSVECPKRLVPCELCGQVFPLFRLDRHQRTDCTHQQ